jgi:hypothetical protein
MTISNFKKKFPKWHSSIDRRGSASYKDINLVVGGCSGGRKREGGHQGNAATKGGRGRARKTASCSSSRLLSSDSTPFALLLNSDSTKKRNEGQGTILLCSSSFPPCFPTGRFFWFLSRVRRPLGSRFVISPISDVRSFIWAINP